jgi:hypothetical protein
MGRQSNRVGRPRPSRLPESLRDLVLDRSPDHATLLAVAWSTLERNGRANLDRVTTILRRKKQEKWAERTGVPHYEKTQRHLETAKQKAVKAIEAYRRLRRELRPEFEQHDPGLVRTQKL